MHSLNTNLVDQLKVFSITFENVSIFQLELTHSATLLKRSEGFKSIKCSYGPTTTQQQAHNRTPAGFYEFQQ